MMVKHFSQEEFDEFALNSGVVGFFESAITLSSGRKSNWYINWRKVSEDVYLTDKLSDYVLAFVRDNKIDADCFYGVPDGATKLAVICTYKLAKQSTNYGRGSHALPMGRAKPKEHGDSRDKYFVGVPRGRTIILEDVTTTGSSLLNTIDNLLEARINIVSARITIVSAIGLTNRMERRDDGLSVKEAVERKGVPYSEMSKATSLLRLAYPILKPAEEIMQAVKREFDEHGIEQLVF